MRRTANTPVILSRAPAGRRTAAKLDFAAHFRLFFALRVPDTNPVPMCILSVSYVSSGVTVTR